MGDSNRHHTTVHHGPISEIIPLLAALVPTSGAFATIVITWIKQNRSDVTIETTRSDGTPFKFHATRLTRDNVLNEQLIELINGSPGVRIRPENMSELEELRSFIRSRAFKSLPKDIQQYLQTLSLALAPAPEPEESKGKDVEEPEPDDENPEAIP